MGLKPRRSTRTKLRDPLGEAEDAALLKEAKSRGYVLVDGGSFPHWDALSPVQRKVALDVIREREAAYRLHGGTDGEGTSGTSQIAGILRAVRMTLEHIDNIGPWRM